MGGFLFNYVEATEEIIGSVAIPYHPINPVWYWIDATRVLCLYEQSDDTTVSGFVVDHSSSTSVAVGPVAAIPGPAAGGMNATKPTPTRVSDAGDWIIRYWDGSITRINISGTTVTPDVAVTPLAWDFLYGDPRVPAGLFEGHDTDAHGQIQLFVPTIYTDMTCLGIDFDTFLVGGALTWDDGTTGYVEIKWYIVSISAGGPQIAFDPATVGTFPTKYVAAQTDVGEGYFWTFAGHETTATFSDPPPDYIRPMSLTQVVATDTTLALTPVTGYDFDTVPLDPSSGGPGWVLHPDDSGRWWLGAVASAPVGAGGGEFPGFWYPDNLFPWTATYVSVVGATGTPHVYVGENNYVSNEHAMGSVWALDTGAIFQQFGTSLLVSDEHARAEMQLDYFAYGVSTPTNIDILGVTAAGLSHNRVIGIYVTFDDPTNVRVAVFKETPIPPSPSWAPDPTRAYVGDVITFRAQSADGFGHDTRNSSRDSYWHPADEYEWQWDDGGSATSSSPTTTHIYRRSSAGHVAGSEIDPPIIPVDPDVGDYAPSMRAHNSVGWSYFIADWFVNIANPPYLRSFPRDDALGAGSSRSWPPSTSVQSGPRSGPTAIT